MRELQHDEYGKCRATGELHEDEAPEIDEQGLMGEL